MELRSSILYEWCISFRSSSEEFVRRFWLGQLANSVIDRKAEAAEGAETAGFSHSGFTLLLRPSTTRWK
jgi:hypothetical protein